ncbi:hypothetical protein DID88_003483 [Monilinia fructigena]|uniref:RNA helicase n=1 Tax=Monilinia fructigena TaxID=38457 RepID=A0A395IU50_9HELO|nr:hypothetical protein DID88_003483 [Monilinia fructigena]
MSSVKRRKTEKDASSGSKSKKVSPSPSPEPIEETKTMKLGIVDSLCEACDTLGYKAPTPIQRESIPLALQGRDLIGFGRNRKWKDSGSFEALGSVIRVKCAVIVGGMDMVPQAIALGKKPHIIVATPGRLLDHLENTKGFSLRSLKYLVMDEADRLLDLDFGPILDKILKVLPRERRTYLFSATISSKVESLQRASLKDPLRVQEKSLLQTDVAARGLDIPSVDVVLNYDMPQDSKTYIHRVGRTARAGKSGHAISFVTQYDVEIWMRIEAALGKKQDEYQTVKDEVMVFKPRVEEAQRHARNEMKNLHEDRGKKGAVLKGRRPANGSKRGRDEMDREEEVIKVEHPTKGDDTRHWGPPYAKYLDGSGKEGPGESAYFFAVNRNKKSLGLSFKHPSAVKILHKLAAESDILVENYLPGSLKKYGMDYETLREINPRLIYASITGYGQTGPYRNRAGYDVMVEAEMGLMHITGSRDGPPVKVGVAVTDLTTGLYTSNSIMAALLARGRTGRGQHIDVALSDCQVATLSNLASSCLISGEKDEGRWGTAHPSIVPYRSYKTKDGDILFGGGNDRLFGLLCDGLGRSDWKENPRFVVNTARVAHRAELDSSIEKITQDRTTQEWLDIFEGSGLPYAAINDVQGTLNHEHVLARDMVKEMDHEYCGPIKMVNTPVKYSESKPSIRTVPPMLGQHTDEILRDLLGLNESEIEALKAEGAVK